MACAFSRLLLFGNTSVRYPSSQCEVCGGQAGTGTGFYLRLLRGFNSLVSFHQCFMLIYLLILLVSGGQAAKNWARTKKATLCRISWNLGPGNLRTRQWFFGYPWTMDTAFPRCFWKIGEANVYTGWSKSLRPPDDYSTKTRKNILNSSNHLPW
jgi:hypothetical protein